MSALRQYTNLVSITLKMNRQEVMFLAVLQLAMSLGFIVGFGYFIPDVSDRQALFLTTGTATNTAVTVALVGLPNTLSQSRAQGRLDYFLTLPISRELYLLGEVSYVALAALPGVVFTIVLGLWYYDLPVVIHPAVLAALPLAITSLAGAGIVLGVYSPHPVLTNAVTNLTMFYVLLFAPILIPTDQLPGVLQQTAKLLPTTYAADAVRASLTHLEGTHMARSLLALAGFSTVSLAAASFSIRRRG